MVGTPILSSRSQKVKMLKFSWFERFVPRLGPQIKKGGVLGDLSDRQLVIIAI